MNTTDKTWFALLVLAALELLSFGLFSGGMGFYHDDWDLLERLSNAGGLWGGIRLFWGLFSVRPLQSLQFPLLFAIGGFHPLPYQLIYLGAEILEGFLLYLLLKRLLEWKGLALLASALILAFPTHAVTHVWFASAGMVISADLVLGGMIYHERWIRSKSSRDLAVGQLLYLAGLLDYEIGAFLPLLLAGGLIGRALADQRKPEDAAKSFLRDFWPYGASLSAVLLWQRVLHASAKPMALSPSHAVDVFWQGLQGATNLAVQMCARVAPFAERTLGWPAVFGAALVAAGIVGVLARASHPSSGARRVLWTALGAAFGGIVGGCLPFAASADYVPVVFGVMSRTNGVIAIGAGLLWATGLAFLMIKSRAWGRAALATAVFFATLTNWGQGSQWAQSWRIQRDVLTKLVPVARILPPSSVLLLGGFPIVLEPGSAMVFSAHWDIGSALRLASGRKDIAADVFWTTAHFEADAAHVSMDASAPAYAYGNLFLYEYSTSRLFRIDGPTGRDAAGRVQIKTTLLSAPQG